jgi:uncharacterized protein YggL (DUF469 family)
VDVNHYKEICEKTGNYNFSLKLLDRTKTTDFLARTAKSYLDECYEGNLIDIINWPSKTQTKEIHMSGVYKSALRDRYRIKELLKYSETFELPDVYIDNTKLEGFLDHFINRDACSGKICGACSADTSKLDNVCTYCAQWAKKVVEMKKQAVEEWLKKSEYTLESLKTSRFFE